MLIAVISFLFPVCVGYMGDVTIRIVVIFLLNITMAILSIGLMWVPRNEVKVMEIVKHIKTVLHIYTLALLLLNAVMIVNLWLF